MGNTARSITLTPAQQQALLTLLQPTNDTTQAGNDISFVSYLYEWLDHKNKRANWSPKTYETYKTIIKVHIEPYFKAVCLSALTLDSLQAFIDYKLESLSNATVEKIQASVIQSSLRDAVRHHYLDTNPADNLYTIKVHNETKHVLSDKEIKALCDVSSTHRLGYTVLLLLSTGMRRCELLALEWADVDLDQCTIRINKDYIDTSKGCYLRPPKTENSNRLCYFPVFLAPVLQAVKDTEKHSFVVSQARCDKRVDPHNYNRLFRSWCKKAGLAGVSPHSLRGTYSTIAYENGNDLNTIMRQCGWNDTRTVLQHYLRYRDNRNLMTAAQTMNTYMLDTLQV